MCLFPEQTKFFVPGTDMGMYRDVFTIHRALSNSSVSSTELHIFFRIQMSVFGIKRGFPRFDSAFSEIFRLLFLSSCTCAELRMALCRK